VQFIPKGERGAALHDRHYYSGTVRIDRQDVEALELSKAVKGGSFLCAPSCCRSYRPVARQPRMVDTALSNLGFRCALRILTRNGMDHDHELR
jgi:formylglycine-generating enzyme required for sulfatase activity